MANKRTATSDLNHDNWDEVDTPEEKGTFSRAPEEVLKTRVFKTGKRRLQKQPPESGTLNIFSGTNLGQFSSAKSSDPSAKLFDFLSNMNTDKKSNGLSNKSSEEEETEKKKLLQTFSFGSTKLDKPEENNGTGNKELKGNASIFTFGGSKPSNFSFGGKSLEMPKPVDSSTFSFINKQPSSSGDTKPTDNLDNYYAKLKGLNQSVAKWINKHVEDNPLINLQPIFKDYEKFFNEIEKVKSIDKSTTATITSETKKVELPPSAATFKFSSSEPAVPKFSFGTVNTAAPTTGTTFGSFNFGSNATKTDTKQDEEESEEPPKVEVKQVEEEGHIYTIKCKVFVKKDGNFVEKGIGSLFLKPVPDSEKIQLIVRAHNSLGNVLCNFILSKGIPTQKMGKNNVMIVCLPTPESQPPPVPVLFKVKTSEEADHLLETLDKHKK